MQNPKTKKSNASGGIRFEKRLYQFFVQPILELNFAVQFGTLPWLYCLVPGVLFNILVILRWDAWIFRRFGLQLLYPHSLKFYVGYVLLGALSGFWASGYIQAVSSSTGVGFV